MNLKWQMINREKFIAERDGYHVVVQIGTAIAPRWSIIKDGLELDNCLYHIPTKDELTAKVQVERALEKIISTTKPLK